LVNSEFELNQGKFKVPLIFGAINSAIDKYGRIEDQYKKDVDNWLCNVYFEIERIKLSEIKIHPRTNELYHHQKIKKPSNLPTVRSFDNITTHQSQHMDLDAEIRHDGQYYRR
jgi:hypothetical protein